ncbi:hypothetical protein P3W33_06490 [Luteibacter sp. PPL552]
MKIVILSFAVLASALTAPAFAGSVSSYISRIYVRQHDGLVYFDTTGPITNRASCGLSNNTWVIPNENTETSKKQYAALLAAKAANLPVDVFGAGTCTRWADSEDVDTIVVHD